MTWPTRSVNAFSALPHDRRAPVVGPLCSSYTDPHRNSGLDSYAQQAVRAKRRTHGETAAVARSTTDDKHHPHTDRVGQIPIALPPRSTASHHPAVSSLKACPTPAH